MVTKKKRDSEQRAAFIRTAREHGCDESEATFMETVRNLAAVKPMTNAQVKKKAKGRSKK